MVKRTCIATTKKLEQHQLIRFVVAPNGFVIADLAGRLPGRGAYVAAEEKIIRKADQNGCLKRSLGAGFESVDAEILAIAIALRKRIILTASLARRCGALLGGSGKLLSEGNFDGLLAAVDASPRELGKLKSKLNVNWVCQSLTSTELGQICGRDSLAFVGLRGSSGSDSAKLVIKVREDIARFDGFYSAAGCNHLPERCIT